MYRVLYYDHGLRQNQEVIIKKAETETEALEHIKEMTKGLITIHDIQKV